ncbi:hypothetical protein ACWGII_38415 [Streptomyces sp. NPDC054855]
MDDNRWFVAEDPHEYDEEPWDFDADEFAFVAALQARASSWRVLSAHSNVCRPEDDSSLLVYVSLIDHEWPVVLGEWAVHFYGTHVRAGKVSDQLFNLHETSERGYFHATGPVEELAERSAAWFETVLSRPVSRTEWLHEGKVYATSRDFADTLEGLAVGFNRLMPPRPTPEGSTRCGAR